MLRLDNFLKNSGQLADFGGDFVFNPLNRDEIEVYKPVEVLEIGTGFMMFTKKTLDTYREHIHNISIALITITLRTLTVRKKFMHTSMLNLIDLRQLAEALIVFSQKIMLSVNSLAKQV